MGDGKKGYAPCGHWGECVVGTYYECPKCDNFEDIPTVEILICKFCGSFDIDEEFKLDPMFYWFNPGVQIVDTRCNTCGKVWGR